MGTNEKEKVIVFFESMADAVGNSDDQPVDAVIAELREEGFDIDKSRNRILGAIKTASIEAKRQQLDVAREKRLAMEEKISSGIGKYYNWSKEQLLGRIRELITVPNASFSFSYRELETKNDEDLAALLEGLELAEAIGKEKGKNEK